MNKKFQKAATWINTAHTANSRKQFDSAARLCKRAIKLFPGFPEAWYNLGIALRGLERRREARDALIQALALTMESADAQNNIGLELYYLGAREEAEKSFRRAIYLAPDYAYAHSNLGLVLKDKGHLSEAEISCSRALELAPDLAPVYVNLCGVLKAQRRYEAAEDACLRAIELDPASSEAHANLGAVFFRLKRHEEAEDTCLKAIELDPASSEAYTNLGGIYASQGSFEKAQAANLKAIELDPDNPDAMANLGINQLISGDYTNGFRNYEYRWEMSNARSKRPVTPLPQWYGEPVADDAAIVVYAEQGTGDSLQFCRYLPLLLQHFSHVAFRCPLSLRRLFQESFSDRVELITGTEEIDPSKFQWHCPLLSLPLAFATTVETIPAGIPYLHVPPVVTKNRFQQLSGSGKPRIGLVWRGSADLQEDHWRSIPLEIFIPVLEIREAQFVSLQKGPAEEELSVIPEIIRPLNPVADAEDYADTAALIQNLDLVIAVDTSVAHLAGAMGKPVWLLNRASSEWRWGWRQENTPWYPSMRIFNQEKFGDWNPVIAQVIRALKEEYAF